MNTPNNAVPALVVTADTSTADVLKILATAAENMKRIQETPWKTNGNYGDGFPNIKDTNGSKIPVDTLIRMNAAAHLRETHYHEAAARMGLSKYPAFQINGGNYEAWAHDIKLRYELDSQEETYNKLKEYSEKMKTFLSAAEQKQQLTADIAEFLGSVSLSPAIEEPASATVIS